MSVENLGQYRLVPDVEHATDSKDSAQSALPCLRTEASSMNTAGCGHAPEKPPVGLLGGVAS